jgi:hypothetical protein
VGASFSNLPSLPSIIEYAERAKPGDSFFVSFLSRDGWFPVRETVGVDPLAA